MSGLLSSSNPWSLSILISRFSLSRVIFSSVFPDGKSLDCSPTLIPSPLLLGGDFTSSFPSKFSLLATSGLSPSPLPPPLPFPTLNISWLFLGRSSTSSAPVLSPVSLPPLSPMPLLSISSLFLGRASTSSLLWKNHTFMGSTTSIPSINIPPYLLQMVASSSPSVPSSFNKLGKQSFFLPPSLSWTPLILIISNPPSTTLQSTLTFSRPRSGLYFSVIFIFPNSFRAILGVNIYHLYIYRFSVEPL